MSVTAIAVSVRPGIIDRLTAFLDGLQRAREARLLRRAEERIDRFNMALSYAFGAAAALEREVPGSVAKLNLERLRIQSTRKCPLAQIYGTYYNAPDHLRDGTVGDGFRIPRALRTEDMNAAWRVVIEEYRKRAA